MGIAAVNYALTLNRINGVEIAVGALIEQLRNSRARALPPRRVLACAVVATAALGLATSAAFAAPVQKSPPVQRHIPPTMDQMQMTKISDLRFGRLVMVGGNDASVTIRADGLPSYRNLVPVDGKPGPAVFEIRGPANRSVQVELTFPVGGSYGAGGTVKLDGLSVSADFTTGFRQDGSLVRLKLDSSGINRIVVGGTLTFTGPNTGHTDVYFPLTASFVQ